MATNGLICPGNSFPVIDKGERTYSVQHSCEIHHVTLEIPDWLILRSNPKVGEEVGINVYLTLAARERRKQRRDTEDTRTANIGSRRRRRQKR